MHSGYYVQQPVYTSGSMIQTSPQYVVQQPGSIEMQSVSMPGQVSINGNFTDRKDGSTASTILCTCKCIMK